MESTPAATRQNYSEKLLELREALLRVEEDRLSGRSGCSVEELDAMLRRALSEARHECSQA